MSYKLSNEEINLLDETCKRLQAIPKTDHDGSPKYTIEYVMGSYLKQHYNIAKNLFPVPPFHKINDFKKYPWPKLEMIDPRERLERAIVKGIFTSELEKHMKETQKYLKWLVFYNNTKNSSKNTEHEKNQTSGNGYSATDCDVSTPPDPGTIS